MRSSPPRLARWLLERWTPGWKRESLIGDIVEQYQRGQSATWFWHQTVSAILISLAVETWQHMSLAVSVVAVSMYLPQIYMRILPPRWWARLDGLWYPHLLNSRWSWLVVNPWAYRLELRGVTYRITFCALLTAVTWIASRLHPRQRGLVVTLLVVTQVGQCIPYLRMAIINWLHDPANPMWFFILVWFSIFTFVAIPLSVRLGVSWGGSEADSDSLLSDGLLAPGDSA